VCCKTCPTVLAMYCSVIAAAGLFLSPPSMFDDAALVRPPPMRHIRKLPSRYAIDEEVRIRSPSTSLIAQGFPSDDDEDLKEPHRGRLTRALEAAGGEVYSREIEDLNLENSVPANIKGDNKDIARDDQGRKASKRHRGRLARALDRAAWAEEFYSGGIEELNLEAMLDSVPVDIKGDKGIARDDEGLKALRERDAARESARSPSDSIASKKAAFANKQSDASLFPPISLPKLF
jgi:hypothetical protein